MREKYGILFDLDGTLWDAVAAITPAWNRVLAKYGKQVTEEDMNGIMGLTDREIARRFLPSLPEEAGVRVVHEAARVEALDLWETGGRLYPGTEETLRALAKEVPLFLVSNCMDGYIPAFLHAHRMEEVFTDAAWLGHPADSKAENIRAVCAGFRLEKAVYVGDTASDGLSARAAGLPFLQALYGFGARAENDGEITAITELPGLLAAFWKE